MYSAQRMKNVNTLDQGAGQLNVDGAVQLAKLLKTTLPTSNGSALLSASLPKNQRSTIAGQYAYWGKGVITNYGFLYGNDLMNKWQGMYTNGVIMGDGTPFTGGTLRRSTALTSGSLTTYQGAIKNNGVLMGDGVMMGDGVLMGDGNPNWANAIYGDNAAGMTSANY